MITLSRISECLEDNGAFSFCSIFSGLVPQQDLDTLAAGFPHAHCVDVQHSPKSDKVYSMGVLGLVSRGIAQPVLKEIHPIWGRFASAILSPQYLTPVSEMLDHVVQPSSIDIGVFRFKSGQGISPHADRAEKLGTHIFYLNRHWPPEWGGALRVLNSRDDTDLVEKITPAAPRSVLIHRSDSSWHSVEGVSPDALSARETIQVEIWKT